MRKKTCHFQFSPNLNMEKKIYKKNYITNEISHLRRI